MAKSFANFTPEAIEKAMDEVKAEVLRFTAADVRSKARRLIPSGEVGANGKAFGGVRKLEKMRQGGHSKPGEPPFSPRKRVNQIVYEVVDENTMIVGPRQFKGKGRFTWKLLEEGGSTEGSFKKIVERKLRKFTRLGQCAARPKAKHKQKNPRPRTDKRKHETIKRARPEGALGAYKYFTSKAKRNRGTASAGFLAWAQSMASKPTPLTKPVTIAARPFMSPAFEAEANESRITRRIEVASRKMKLK